MYPKFYHIANLINTKCSKFLRLNSSEENLFSPCFQRGSAGLLTQSANIQPSNCIKLSCCRLDLDKWINDPPSDSSDEDMTSSTFFPNTGMNDDFRSSYNNEEKRKTYEPTEEELEIVSWFFILAVPFSYSLQSLLTRSHFMCCFFFHFKKLYIKTSWCGLNPQKAFFEHFFGVLSFCKRIKFSWHKKRNCELDGRLVCSKSMLKLFKCVKLRWYNHFSEKIFNLT